MATAYGRTCAVRYFCVEASQGGEERKPKQRESKDGIKTTDYTLEFFNEETAAAWRCCPSFYPSEMRMPSTPPANEEIFW